MSTKHWSVLRTAISASVSLSALTLSLGAHAQSTPSSGTSTTASTTELQEVIVTARKREESILNVPVIEQAIPQEQLERLQVTELTDLPKLAPGLNFGHSLLSIGTLVSIRGIGTASQDPGVDQSVSLNIDGMSLGNGLAYNSGLFDVAQVEVLKGPQALFYGKSSPGGVISIRTADPTDKYEVIARGEYEFESVNPRGELILSGPVADTLKVRVAGMYSTADGYFHNVAVAEPGTGALTPTDSHNPDSTDSMVRLTALWDPISQLTGRLKINYAYDKAINAESSECTDAPTGTQAPGFPAFLGPNGCGPLSRDERLVYLNPANFPLATNGGVPFLKTNQAYGTLDFRYRPMDVLTVTSTTGYYTLSSQSLVNPYETSFAGPELGITNHFHRRELTEELRANTDLKGPLNYTLGLLYEDGALIDHVQVLGNNAYPYPLIPGFTPILPAFPPLLQDGFQPIDILTKSIFGQARWDIIERLELAAGLRWTDEARDEAPTLGGAPVAVPVPRIHSDKLSPEVTLTWRATDDLTLFGAWKEGFKSGSFSIATPITIRNGVPADNSFGDETVRGGEGGLKSRWLDRRLAVNVAGYYYNYSGLQVGAISPPANGVPVIQTVNAASARTYGVDLDTAFRPETIAGLTLNGALEWNHGRYLNFNTAPCWGGQSIAQGCNQNTAVLGANSAQNLAGTPLIRAPQWEANGGLDYELPIQNNYTLVVSQNTQFSSRFVTFLGVDRPNDDNYQGSFVKVDLSVAVRAPNDLWELAVLGKDLNDRITSGNCNNAPLLTETVANPAGLPGRSPFGIDPVQCFPDPGREVWLRLTIHPLAGRD